MTICLFASVYRYVPITLGLLAVGLNMWIYIHGYVYIYAPKTWLQQQMIF
jgi:hypothetical protein